MLQLNTYLLGSRFYLVLLSLVPVTFYLFLQERLFHGSRPGGYGAVHRHGVNSVDSRREPWRQSTSKKPREDSVKYSWRTPSSEFSICPLPTKDVTR